MNLDWRRAQSTVQRMIKRFGRPAALRTSSTGALRYTPVVLTNWRVQELFGRLYDPLSRKALFGQFSLPGGPPDHQSETLVTYRMPLGDPPLIEENLRLLNPAVPVNLAGYVIYWFVPVRDI